MVTELRNAVILLSLLMYRFARFYSGDRKEDGEVFKSMESVVKTHRSPSSWHEQPVWLKIFLWGQGSLHGTEFCPVRSGQFQTDLRRELSAQ